MTNVRAASVSLTTRAPCVTREVAGCIFNVHQIQPSSSRRNQKSPTNAKMYENKNETKTKNRWHIITLPSRPHCVNDKLLPQLS